jgi:hypothetical protein
MDQLLALGFDATQASNALEFANGNVSLALTFLRDQQAVARSTAPVDASMSMGRSTRSNAGFDALSERGANANCNDELDVEHLEDEDALCDTLRESEFWELLKSLNPELLQATRDRGQSDVQEAARFLQEHLPDVDVLSLVATFQNVFYTFIFDEHDAALHGINLHGEGDDVAMPPESLGSGSRHHAVPSAIVAALQLSESDVEEILKICDWVGSTFASIAPIFVRSGRNSAATLSALQQTGS